MKLEEMWCASPDCAVASMTHPRTRSCPPISSTTIREILADLAEEAEAN